MLRTYTINYYDTVVFGPELDEELICRSYGRDLHSRQRRFYESVERRQPACRRNAPATVVDRRFGSGHMIRASAVANYRPKFLPVTRANVLVAPYSFFWRWEGRGQVSSSNFFGGGMDIVRCQFHIWFHHSLPMNCPPSNNAYILLFSSLR